MLERVIDLADDPARLSVRTSLLVIERGGEPEVTVPLEEVAVLMLANPVITLTQPVLARLSESGAMVVICDTKRMPAAMMLPLEAHFVQGERFVKQAAASAPLQNRLWQSIVKAKISHQAKTLLGIRGHDAGLPELLPKVRSGDPSNVEGEAARRYWPVLFNHPDFRRSRYGGGPNSLLNYGYAVLRAIIARGICAAGLHPSLGLHHHNRYDAFRLADDLMEPYRPIVDQVAASYCERNGLGAKLEREAKALLLGALLNPVPMAGKSRTLFDSAQRTAGSLADVLAGKRRTLLLPEL
jgi:CRISP-associated protein Cas1